MIARVLREPLVHFGLLAVLIFAWFYATADENAFADRDGQILIDEDSVGLIAAGYRRQWGRMPTQEELEQLVEKSVTDEILVREARALNLDLGDAVIRNRLIMKMQFFADSAVQGMEPDDAVLQAHMDSKPEEFSLPGLLAFEQVYLGQHIPEDDGAAVLAQLRAGADPKTLSVSSMLPAALPNGPAPSVDRTFGSGFAEAVAAQEMDQWAGPVQSGFGWHMVRLTSATPGRAMELPEARGKVLFDWRRDMAEKINEQQLEFMRSQYDVQLPEMITVPSQAKAPAAAPESAEEG